MPNPKLAPTPKSFRSPEEFRRWLERHHATEKELVIRLFKNAARHRGMGYAEALDEALCFGWIDGVRRSFDADSFTTRFTPRKPKSKWSRVNLRHFERLKAAGKVHSAGHAALDAGTSYHEEPYSFEAGEVLLASPLAKRFQANKAAWTFFTSQAPWYRRVCTFFVMSAKKEETRERRLALLMKHSARQERLPALGGPKK